MSEEILDPEKVLGKFELTRWEVFPGIGLCKDGDGDYVEVVLPQEKIDELHRRAEAELPKYIKESDLIRKERGLKTISEFFFRISDKKLPMEVEELETFKDLLKGDMLERLFRLKLMDLVLEEKNVGPNQIALVGETFAYLFELANRGRLRFRAK